MNKDVSAIKIEDFIPHRGLMKLIDGVHEINEADDYVVTYTDVTTQRPLLESGSLDPAVLIELVAQSASFAGGYRHRHESAEGGKGWLVGVKKAVFSGDPIPLNSRLFTKVKERHSFDRYSLVDGTVHMDGREIARISIQAYKIDGDIEEILGGLNER